MLVPRPTEGGTCLPVMEGHSTNDASVELQLEGKRGKKVLKRWQLSDFTEADVDFDGNIEYDLSRLEHSFSEHALPIKEKLPVTEMQIGRLDGALASRQATSRKT